MTVEEALRRLAEQCPRGPNTDHRYHWHAVQRDIEGDAVACVSVEVPRHEYPMPPTWTQLAYDAAVARERA